MCEAMSLGGRVLAQGGVEWAEVPVCGLGALWAWVPVRSHARPRKGELVE